MRAHIRLDGPIVVVWDNLNTHLAARLKRYEAEHDWLTTVRLPPYAPDLNPVEAVWSLVRRAMANTSFVTPDDLDGTLRRELRRIQLRPHLIDGCLTATSLAINPPTPPRASVTTTPHQFPAGWGVDVRRYRGECTLGVGPSVHRVGFGRRPESPVCLMDWSI
ncbi:transposase [Streptomyces spororaveus]|uniref:transposase n=1 Tax=Streptomyces spororaveus TaxID=284039 RepID=UPI0036B86CD3